MALTPAIELNALGHRFGERWVLRDVSVTVPPGATVAVLGANGTGKSTLLRILAGLVRPTDGRAAVLGRAMPDDAWAVHSNIGLLTHEPLLYRELTARENLTYYARLFRVSETRVNDALDAVGLLHRADDRIAEFSRGMVQRTAVARAVLHEPSVLLLDEPTANLDPAAALALAPLIGADSAATRVITSHDPAAALAEADLALALGDGGVIYAGPAAGLSAARAASLYGPATAKSRR